MTALEFAGAAMPLGPADIAAVAQSIGVEPAAIEAVCDVESNGNGFLPDRRPVILFESHVFHTLTGGRWDRSHPGISTSAWVRNYGAAGAHQYDRLAEAIALDRPHALQSASWGRFQIMGQNCKICGFADAEAMVSAFMASEKAHLAGFVAFCQGNHLIPALKAKEWAVFARGYNGSGQVAHYATALAMAYSRHARAA